MGRRRADRLEFTKGLGFRLAALLSVAILPLGLISLIQTLSLSQEAERSAEIALLGRTASAASGERALLQSALGTADALGPAVLNTLNDPAACSQLMRGFIQRSAAYVYAGFVPLSGKTQCTSSNAAASVIDMRSSPAFQDFVTNPSTLMLRLERGRLGKQAVVLVMLPLHRDRDLLGYIAVSLSQELLRSTHSVSLGTEGAQIITFNHLGEVLTSDSAPSRSVDSLLPRGQRLIDLASRTDTTFRAYSNAGDSRAFAVTSVVPGLVYALGSWSPQTAGIGAYKMSRLAAFAVPVALWAVSLTVAYFAVFRLVLRHISELRGQMRRFAIGERDAPPPVITGAPAEITDVSQTFHDMARVLIRDEDALARAVNEKTVLLKELHHRVKNNLQLIASIINMQSRVIEDEDALRVLRSVQDRVSALATIYRNLYQAEHLDHVEADRLIGDIINHMTNASVGPGRALKIDTQIQPLTLMPDQAVPLSLLATEAFTNAVKYAGIPPGDDQAWVRVTLQQQGAYKAVLQIINSTSNDQNPSGSEGSGLGSQLIDAFAMQLDGRAEHVMDGHSFALHLTFRIDKLPVSDGDAEREVVLTSLRRDGIDH